MVSINSERNYVFFACKLLTQERQISHDFEVNRKPGFNRTSHAPSAFYFC
jgi:hypothetical protein